MKNIKPTPLARIVFMFLVLPLFLTSCSGTGGKTEVDDIPLSQVFHPEWSINANIYEVNIRQYTPEGTFNAFAGHLPRLKEMGVDILWFMPITPIGEKERKGTLGSYYSVKDYTAVNPEFGTMDDFKSLVEQVHNSGMYVILDWVANHTAWDHHWTVTNPEYYHLDDDGNFMLPNEDWTDVIDLNYDNPDLWDAMIGEMIFWVKEANIDGFRCDVADLVPVDFWNRARSELDKVKPVFMLAEAEYPPLHEYAFNTAYGWRFHHIMSAVARGDQDVTAIDEYYFTDNQGNFPLGSYKIQFIDNHDENSWNGTVFDRYGEGKEAFAILAATTPGMFLMYNGQEAGLDKRLEFFEKDLIDWSNLRYEGFYKKLLYLKRNNKALWNGLAGGEIERIVTNQDKKIFAFNREKGDNMVVVILNLASESVAVNIYADGMEGEFTDLFSDDNSQLLVPKQFTMRPWEYRVLYR
jgi:cyclomaltodextrinase / maltogenic alpha-amylase / neopullulanase